MTSWLVILASAYLLAEPVSILAAQRPAWEYPLLDLVCILVMHRIWRTGIPLALLAKCRRQR